MPSTTCQILFKELMVQGEGRCVIKGSSFVEGNGRMEARAGSYVEKRKKQAQLGFGGEREKQGCLLEDGRFWANIKGRARISPAKSWEEATGVSGGRGSRAGTETPRWDTLPRVWGAPDGEERWGCSYRQGPPWEDLLDLRHDPVRVVVSPWRAQAEEWHVTKGTLRTWCKPTSQADMKFAQPDSLANVGHSCGVTGAPAPGFLVLKGLCSVLHDTVSSAAHTNGVSESYVSYTVKS